MNKPLVGLIMGSDSDLSLMQEAAAILDTFTVPYEITIVSAHRTPKRMVAYAESAEKRGLKVIIACAGGAAHLPGMTAALTVLPVIGVPRELKTLHGIDSLLSIAQMPPGVPVATVAINGALNAGLLAVKILATQDTKLATRLRQYQASLKNNVTKKALRLEKIGAARYQAHYLKK